MRDIGQQTDRRLVGGVVQQHVSPFSASGGMALINARFFLLLRQDAHVTRLSVDLVLHPPIALSQPEKHAASPLIRFALQRPERLRDECFQALDQRRAVAVARALGSTAGPILLA